MGSVSGQSLSHHDVKKGVGNKNGGYSKCALLLPHMFYSLESFSASFLQ